MTVYFVQTTYVANEENKNFRGQTQIHYSGRGGEPIAAFNSSWDFDYRNRYMAENYGYKRECDARRSYNYKNPQNDKHWRSTTEIVPYEY